MYIKLSFIGWFMFLLVIYVEHTGSDNFWNSFSANCHFFKKCIRLLSIEKYAFNSWLALTLKCGEIALGTVENSFATIDAKIWAWTPTNFFWLKRLYWKNTCQIFFEKLFSENTHDLLPPQTLSRARGNLKFLNRNLIFYCRIACYNKNLNDYALYV